MGGIVPWARGQVGVYMPTFGSLTPQVVSSPPQPTLREWWKELQGETAPKPPSRVQSAVVGLRHNGESAAIGALLAFIDTDLGGLDLGGRVPLDWVGAALFYALSIREHDSTEGLGSDFRAMSQSCTTVATYRMMHRWREAKQAIPQNSLSGDAVLKAGKSGSF
jgi:hypothetical protein